MEERVIILNSAISRADNDVFSRGLLSDSSDREAIDPAEVEISPGILFHPCFQAGLLEECACIPSVLLCEMGKKVRAFKDPSDEDAVFSDAQGAQIVFGVAHMDLSRGAEDDDLDSKLGKLGFGYRLLGREAKCSSMGCRGDSPGKGHRRFRRSEGRAQRAAKEKVDIAAMVSRQYLCNGRAGNKDFPSESGSDRVSGKLDKGFALGLGIHEHLFFARRA